MFEYGLHKLMINVDLIIFKILMYGLSVANFAVLFSFTTCRNKMPKGGGSGRSATGGGTNSNGKNWW